MARLTIRVDLGKGGALGPGKIRLLELIQSHGSISEAGRVMGMSYRQAWLLVDNLNQSFRQAVVSKQTGGRRGGGARLTAVGSEGHRALPGDRERPRSGPSPRISAPSSRRARTAPPLAPAAATAPAEADAPPPSRARLIRAPSTRSRRSACTRRAHRAGLLGVRRRDLARASGGRMTGPSMATALTTA